MRKLFNKKYVRIAIGVVFLFCLIVSIVPSFYLYNSTDGVVNARTTTLSSPIEGVLRFSSPIKYGKKFNEGELIGKVLHGSVNHSFLYELLTEKRMLDSRIISYTKRVASYRKLSESLKKNLATFQHYSIKQLELHIKREEHSLAEEQSELKRAEKEYKANKILSAKFAIDQRTFERTESNYNASLKRVLQIKSQIDEMKNSLKAVKVGSFLEGGDSDSPYSKQRMDQMVIEISLAETVLLESKSRVKGINDQIEAEKARIKKVECFEIVAPFDSLVWRQPLTEGSTVVINSELIVLLDCSHVFLDIAVSESEFSNILPGDKIQYRLIGDLGYHEGEVFSLHGSGAELGDHNLAAVLNKDSKKEFRVWISANPVDLELSPENYYQVGHRVEVKIPRKWQPSKFFSRLIDVF